METLAIKVTGSTCSRQVDALRAVVGVDERTGYCLGCCDHGQCPNYQPVNHTEKRTRDLGLYDYIVVVIRVPRAKNSI